MGRSATDEAIGDAESVCELSGGSRLGGSKLGLQGCNSKFRARNLCEHGLLEPYGDARYDRLYWNRRVFEAIES